LNATENSEFVYTNFHRKKAFVLILFTKDIAEGIQNMLKFLWNFILEALT